MRAIKSKLPASIFFCTVCNSLSTVMPREFFLCLLVWNVLQSTCSQEVHFSGVFFLFSIYWAPISATCFHIPSSLKRIKRTWNLAKNTAFFTWTLHKTEWKRKHVCPHCEMHGYIVRFRLVHLLDEVEITQHQKQQNNAVIKIKYWKFVKIDKTHIKSENLWIWFQ